MSDSKQIIPSIANESETLEKPPSGVEYLSHLELLNESEFRVDRTLDVAQEEILLLYLPL